MRLLVATLFFSGVWSAPFSNFVKRPVSRECKSDGARFHTKKSSQFIYEGETITGLVGTSEERSGLKLRAKCEITPVLPCVYMLKVLKAELLESQGKKQDSLDFKLSSGSKKLSVELQARELYFESHGGVITSVRPKPEEPKHILNVKRGILSAFQLKQTNKNHAFTEVDVNGECRANYHIKSRHEGGLVKTVLKRKDLSLCKDRSTTNLGIPVTQYPTDKPFSLLKSNSLCQFVLSLKQRIKSVSCKETHLFRPFSSGYNSSSGVLTTVRQKIMHVGHSARNDGQMFRPETEKFSLKYEPIKANEVPTKNVKEVSHVLKKLAAEEGAQPYSARFFTKLVFAFRRLDRRALKVIWYQYYDCLERGRCTKEEGERYQKYIVDALSQCGTLHCAQFMVSVITEKKVGAPQSIAFLTGIALVGKPSEDMVGNILMFCQRTPSRTAFLTLGTLMHKYCSQHSCDNLNQYSQIYRAEKFLRSKLHQNCQSSSPEELETITLALKAIGNAGRPFHAVENILKCAVQPGPTFVNIDALQALRRMPCSKKTTRRLLDMYGDLTMDSEIRIESYLALMRCPSDELIKKVADLLETEKNNQVGSFVWSHLTNVLESTEPVHGVPLRDIVSKALKGRTLREFKLDHLRFSHAYEASYYNKKFEVGGSSQAQVIFHPDSFFPRSAKLNFTIDMLGASINLLETAARFEGFETLVERMFGPEGYFPDDRLMQFLNIAPTGGSRERRSTTDDEMDEIKTNLEKLQDKMRIDRKNPTGALSFKLFGHEIQFMNVEDIDWLVGEADETINVIDTLISIARGGKVTYTKSFMLLEADQEIATGLGFPLRLAVNGSGVGSVTLKGKFDIRNMFWGKKKLDVRGFVSPSAIIDISGRMTVDAIHATSGVHMNTSMFTSTEINGNVTYKEGEGMKLSIEPPSKPVYIINVSSNLATFVNDKREKISGSLRRFEHQNCADFSRFLGVNLCGHISLPMAYRDYHAPYFPLSGDSSLGMVFQTTNPDLARFEIEGRKLISEDENRYDWLFNMHVPGLTFGRKIVGNTTFQFLEDGKYLGISWGIFNYKFGKFEAKYNNRTNGLHTKFSTPQMSFVKPITIETEIFNQTNAFSKAQDIGISINASYSNFTVQDVLSFYKRNDQYGVKSQFTYWPTKHITTEARFSLEKRSIFLKMNDSGTTNNLFLAGKLGKSASRFYGKIGNYLMNYEVRMNGEVNYENRKVMLDVFTKPFGGMWKFEAYPRWNALENGFYVRLSHGNSSSHVTGYLGSSNLKRESTLKFDGVWMKKPFLLRASHYVLSRGRKVEWIAQGFDNSAKASLEMIRKDGAINLLSSATLNDETVNSKASLFKKTNSFGLSISGDAMENTGAFLAEYFREQQDNGLRLKLTANGKAFETVAKYFKTDKEKGLNFTIARKDQSANVILSYYNKERENGLKLRAAVLDKSFELASGLYSWPAEYGLVVRGNILDQGFEARWSILSGKKGGMKFSASYAKKEIMLRSTWLSNDNAKEWTVDAMYNGKTISLVSAYRLDDKSLCSDVLGLTTERLGVCVRLINNDGEKGVRLTVEGMKRSAELEACLLENDESRVVQMKMFYNRALLSDFSAALLTPATYTGLRLKGIVKGKTAEALLKYENSNMKRSLDLDLRIQGHKVTFENILLRQPALKGVQVNMIYQNKPIGSWSAILQKKYSGNIMRIGLKAMNYGAEYKFAFGKSRLQTKLSSMLIFSASSKHYKYGYAVLFSRRVTKAKPNYMITTRLHYARKKVLTSIYQFVNSKKTIYLSSKVEIAPGQHLNNKIAYSKATRTFSMSHELLPGIGMTYLATFMNNEQTIGIVSNLTVLNYPMGSAITLDKHSGDLTGALTYCPVRPPVEFTGHFRRNNGIDMGISLNAFSQVLRNTFLLNYTTKQLEMNVDILPNVPIHISAKLFENHQFVWNISTCTAFSAELVGKKATEEDYEFVLKHQFISNVFEDFKLSVHSLEHLKKLRVRWESKSGREILRNFGLKMQMLLNGTVLNMTTLGASTKQIVSDIVTYMRTDGHDKVMAVVNKSSRVVKQLMEDLKIIEDLERYHGLATEVVGKTKDDLLALIKDMKTYGTKLMETYNYIEDMTKEILSELSPYTRLFASDFKNWLSRAVNRYSAVSIYDSTTKELIGKITKAINFHWMTMWNKSHNVVQHFERMMQEIISMTSNLRSLLNNSTCNYDLECIQNNVQGQLKELSARVPYVDIGRITERLNKVIKMLMQRYSEVKFYVLRTAKDRHLQEKAMKVLQPFVELLKTAAHEVKTQVMPLQDKMDFLVAQFKSSEFMSYYNKVTICEKELLRAIEKTKMFAAKHFSVVQVNLLNSLNHLKVFGTNLKAETLVLYRQLVTLIQKLYKMSPKELQAYTNHEIEIHYEKVKENLEHVRKSILTKVKSHLERYADEIKVAKKVMTVLLSASGDFVSGRLTTEDAKEQLELIKKSIFGYLKAQKVRVLERILALKLDDAVKKTYNFVIQLYEHAEKDLTAKVTTLYPKTVAHLKDLVVKMKRIAEKYMKLAVSKVNELWMQQKIYSTIYIAKMHHCKEKMIKKARDILKNYSTLEFIDNLKLDAVKLLKICEEKVKNLVTVCRKQLETSLEKTIVTKLNHLKLYQHIPLQKICEELKLNLKTAFVKIVGFVIDETISAYENASVKAKVVKKFCEDIKHVIEATWEKISDGTRAFNQKYGPVARQDFDKALTYFNENVKPVLSAYVKELGTLAHDLPSLYGAKYERLKLWYEHIKYMKLKELYMNIKDDITKWDFNMKKLWEEKMYELREMVEKMKAKIQNFTHEVKKETLHVLHRLEQANEDVRRDTILTFKPYEKLMKRVLLKHKDKSLKQFAPFVRKYEDLAMQLTNYKLDVEQYVKHYLQKVKNLDQGEVKAEITSMLKRLPLTAVLKKYLEPRLMLARVLESLDRCPFLHQVRTHQLWFLIKQEFMDHELVVASRELAELLMKTFEKIPTEFYPRCSSKLAELKTNAYLRLQQFIKDLLKSRDRIEKKRSEVTRKLRQTTTYFSTNGQQLMAKAWHVCETGIQKGEKVLERFGGMTLNDIEKWTKGHMNGVLSPMKATYTDFSDLIVAELLVLDKQYRTLAGHLKTFGKMLMARGMKIKNQFEDISVSSIRWGMHRWNESKPEIDYLQNVLVKVFKHAEYYGVEGLTITAELLDKFVPYKNVLKMTPDEIYELLQEMPLEVEGILESTKETSARIIISSVRMAKALMTNIDAKKIQDLKLSTQVLLDKASEHLHFLISETLHTAMFLNTFYGSPDTVYSRHPKLVRLANYHMRKFITCLTVCKTNAMKLFSEARSTMEKLYTKASDFYLRKIPHVVLKIGAEIKDMDTKNLKEVVEIAKEYLELSIERAKGTIAETVVSLEISGLKVQDYVKSETADIDKKLMMTKEKLMKHLKKNAPHLSEIVKKLLMDFEYLEEFISLKRKEVMVHSARLIKEYKPFLNKYVNADLVKGLPILVTSAYGKFPIIWRMITNDIEVLMNDTVSNMQKCRSYLQERVFPNLKERYSRNVNKLAKCTNHLKNATNDLVFVIKKNVKSELLPILNKIVSEMLEALRETELTLINGDVELKLPRLAELRKLSTELNIILAKKLKQVDVTLSAHYRDAKQNGRDAMELLTEDLTTTWSEIRGDVSSFCKSKIVDLLELTESRLMRVQACLKKKFQRIQEISSELLDKCKKRAIVCYNMSKDMFDMARELNYKQEMSKYFNVISTEVNKMWKTMKTQALQVRKEISSKTECLRHNFTRMSDQLVTTLKLLKKIGTTLHQPGEMRKHLNRYVDVDDLINKTIEIQEDIYNLGEVQDLLALGKSLYNEGSRMIDLAKETSEFALYVLKRVVKYSDIWEIVEELTNPFHWVPPTKSVAMIFGKPHVHTFDGETYQFVGYKKPSCTYVLAHDFRDNNFTLMSQETALIINTRSGFIKIHDTGKIEATVSKDAEGNDVKTTHTELPVEMKQMSVKREGSFIKIKHDTGLDVVCDLRHFLCTFNIHSFYHGKLAGLLGTNNNEQYDEFLKPDKTIAQSVLEFANAWEVSGDAECQVHSAVELKTSCAKKPSPRCEELFASSSSPLAPYFKTVDPKPFYKACLFDTSDCDVDVSATRSFCNVTAAYTTLLREKGIWARQLPECVSCGTKHVWQTWINKGSKNVDVVLLIPETLTLQSHADNLPSFLKELETDLAKYRPRYAVVGFGGKTAVRREPHIVTSGGKIFGSIKDVQSAIANMKFTTEAADLSSSIEYLAHLPFLPGASKVVIMITDDDRGVISSVPVEKAIKELNMQGVVFDVIGPYFQKKQHRDVIGLWKNKAMLRKSKFFNKPNDIRLPLNDYIRLAESTQGGIFNLKAYSKTHGDWSSLLKKAIKTTIIKQIDDDQTYCRQCVCVPSLTTEPVTVCRINRHSRCA